MFILLRAHSCIEVKLEVYERYMKNYQKNNYLYDDILTVFESLVFYSICNVSFKLCNQMRFK